MEKIIRLLGQGMSVRQVVAQTGYSRKQVKEIAEAMKRQRKSSTGKGIAIIAALTIGAIVFFSLIAKHSQSIAKSNDPTTWRPAVVQAISELRKTFTVDKWLLEDDNVSEETIRREVQISKEYTERLNAALVDNSNIPEVKILKDEFAGKFYSSVFSASSGGTSRRIFLGSTLEEANKPEPAGAIEVCFYPRNAQNHPHIKGELLFYDPDWRSLFIGALNYPDKRWFDALAIHELWHAHLHRLGALSATAPMLSDSWISEELQAHSLENAVLDNGTRGAYLKTVHLISSGIHAKTLGDFLRQIKAEQLKQLDSEFSKCSDFEGSVHASQYLITLANDWLGQRYKDEKLQQEQIESYRILSRNF